MPGRSPRPAAGVAGRGRAGAPTSGGGAWRPPRWEGVHATAAPDGAAGADRVSAVSSARSATSADSAATGSADRRMARQVGASSIQVGISFCRATSAPTRLHRAQAPASRSSTWWTWTKCPAHGCQAYATTTSAAVPVLWVLCRRVLEDLEVLEHRRPGLLAGAEADLVDVFDLERGEEALH